MKWLSIGGCGECSGSLSVRLWQLFAVTVCWPPNVPPSFAPMLEKSLRPMNAVVSPSPRPERPESADGEMSFIEAYDAVRRACGCFPGEIHMCDRCADETLALAGLKAAGSPLFPPQLISDDDPTSDEWADRVPAVTG